MVVIMSEIFFDILYLYYDSYFDFYKKIFLMSYIDNFTNDIDGHDT